MAMDFIKVDTSKLDSAATTIETLAGDYNTAYISLYNAVDTLRGGLSGTEGDAFIDQIGEFKNDFQNMEKLMRRYAEFLKTTAADYRKTKEEQTTEARRLNTGK